MRSSGVQAVVAEDESGRIVPVCGCYRTDLQAQFARSLEAGRRALTPFTRALEITTVPLRAGEARNVNEPSDLSAADGV